MVTVGAAVTVGPLIAGAAAVALSSLGRNKGMAAGLLLHSVDEKAGMSMSSYPKNKFGRLLDILKSRNIETITISQQLSPIMTTTSPLPPHKTVITFDDGLQSFYDNAYPLLEKKGFKATIFAVAGVVGKSGGWDVMGRTRHMTAGMIREAADAGHEVGSHSLTHANLVWLDDRELMRELRDSKAILEDIIGQSIKSLSFPFGSWNRRVWDAARSAGYEYAAIYRGHGRALPGMLPVLGGYRFDSAEDIVVRILPNASSILSSSISKTTAKIMSHFSKGTPICMFRKEYTRWP